MSVYIKTTHISFFFFSYLFFKGQHTIYILSVRTNYLSRAVCYCIETDATD